MITYDSGSCRDFLRTRGSVFPKALLHSLPSALLAFGLKFIESLGYVDFEDWGIMKDGSVYGGITFTLGFALVFRTSQCYDRYWTSATAVHQMRSEWFDACASLIAFVKVSKKPERERLIFEHTTVRLFSLLHGLALEELADLRNENFPILDIGGLAVEDLSCINTPENEGRKVEFVFQWIKLYIVKAMDSGILSTPPPILTRVFQELGLGLVHFHDVMQIVMWPFPFPYAQLTVFLIIIHQILTPLVICQWTWHWWWAFILTFISVVCLKALDCIAIELENPFGEDANDLPVYELHESMNQSLLLLMNPNSWRTPRLAEGACLDYEALEKNFEKVNMSLNAYTKGALSSGEGKASPASEDKFDSKRQQVVINMETKSPGDKVPPEPAPAPTPAQPAAKTSEPPLQELLQQFKESIRLQRQQDFAEMLKQQEAAHVRYLQAFEGALGQMTRMGGPAGLPRAPVAPPPQQAAGFFRCSDVSRAPQ